MTTIYIDIEMVFIGGQWKGRGLGSLVSYRGRHSQLETDIPIKHFTYW